MLNDDLHLMEQVQSWLQRGQPVALAVTLRTWGSAPRPVGSLLAISDSGQFEGSVSGGCVENAVIEEADEIIRTGVPKVLSYGVTDETAWTLGLPCGGTIDLLVIRLNDSGMVQTILEHTPVALFVRTSTGELAVGNASQHSGEFLADDTHLQAAAPLLAQGRTALEEIGGHEVLIRPFVRPWRLMIVGAVHIAQPLSTMAQLAGFDVTVIDPRSAYLTAERFPDLERINDWPDDALKKVGLDARCAVAILSHDHKIDDPALLTALDSPAFYVGALGSRRNHQRRRQRLSEEGVTAQQLDRIDAPIGLDIGGRSAGEIAVSILAQVITTRTIQTADG
ncbi:MAG: XdhC/CoxI family protein [Pseudomonadota bacterium]|nr:MAG: XdhC/CoxI family protein [Pseudomonadota bacterium]